MANGMRLLLAARKSRKGEQGTDYERQDFRAKTWAEREEHAVVGTPSDTVSSQTPPWKRKELKPWMTDSALMAMYDGILISDTDRLSRGTDVDFHYIEHWAIENRKRIVVANGPQFPPRDGAMGESDRYQWIAQKRAARTFWESVRDKHADTREIIKANGAAIGLAPFGYTITGAKLHKTFVVDAVNGELAREAFRRISEGHTATSVAVWLTEVTGKLWRVKRVTDMISRRTYLGERDGHAFEALVSQEMFDQANNALAARSFKHVGGRRTEHGYSGIIFCECGAQMYRHQSTREGKDVGQAKYRCGRGRRGDVTESKCSYGAPTFDMVNSLVDVLMSKTHMPEIVVVVTGGDHGKQMELSKLQDEMKSAMSKMDMSRVTELAAQITQVQNMESEQVETKYVETGRMYSEMWQEMGLEDRRSMVERLPWPVVVRQRDGVWTAVRGSQKTS